MGKCAECFVKINKEEWEISTANVRNAFTSIFEVSNKQVLDFPEGYSTEINTDYIYRPCGKESTKVWITQNKRKESENSYQNLKISWWTDTRKHTETKSKYFDWHGRLSQSEESKCLWTHDKDGITGEFMNGWREIIWG